MRTTKYPWEVKEPELHLGNHNWFRMIFKRCTITWSNELHNLYCLPVSNNDNERLCFCGCAEDDKECNHES